MKIKICGLTNARNARAVACLNIDAIGLVFFDKSPRNVAAQTAAKIIQSLPPFVNRVGLFVNASPQFIDDILRTVPLDTLQFHGDETPADCAQYSLPFIKALRVDASTNIAKAAADYHQASGLLLDAFSARAYGGTGSVFDWSLAKVAIDLPIILAGGLTADNVADAAAQVQPYAVDVSSGVESAPGVKDLTKIQRFITGATKNE